VRSENHRQQRLWPFAKIKKNGHPYSRLQFGWNLDRTSTRKQVIKAGVLTFFLTPTSVIRSKSFAIHHASCYHRHHYHISKPQMLPVSCNKQHKMRTRDSLFEMICYSTAVPLPNLLCPTEPRYHSPAVPHRTPISQPSYNFTRCYTNRLAYTRNRQY